MPKAKIWKAVRMKVTLAQLQVNPAYQRGFVKSHGASIKSTLVDPSDLSEITVNRRGGKFFVIDGQHTLWVLQQEGYTHAIVRIKEDWSVEQEARLFWNKATGTRSIDGWVAFRAALTAKDNNHVRMIEILSAAGLTTGLTKSPSKDADVTDAKRVKDQWKKGEEHFQRLADILATGWVEDSDPIRRPRTKQVRLQEDARRYAMFSGLGNFLANEGVDFRDARVINTLRANSAAAVLSLAAKLAEAGGVKSIGSLQVQGALCLVFGLALPRKLAMLKNAIAA